MSELLQIKVHDVLHDECDYNPSDAEDYIEDAITSVSVKNVRVAPGHTNSPLFVTVNRASMTLDDIKTVARKAVNWFTEFVDGIDVERTIRDDNIRIFTVGD